METPTDSGFLPTVLSSTVIDLLEPLARLPMPTQVFLVFIFIVAIQVGRRSKAKAAKRPPKTPKTAESKDSCVQQRRTMKWRDSEEFLYQSGLKLGGNNVVTRHLQNTCHELDNFDRNTPLNKKQVKLPSYGMAGCYGCGRMTRSFHGVYVFSCPGCGTHFQQMRHFSRNLGGQVALVIGCRTKLGHQVALKLLRAGAIVIGTTRKPESAQTLYTLYHDHADFAERLFIYPVSLDLDCTDVASKAEVLAVFIEEKFGHLDILVNCAAQTIRARDKPPQSEPITEETNRYGDDRFVSKTLINSWQMELHDLNQGEMEEVLRVNSVAPCLLIQKLYRVMRSSKVVPYIINVHAREGIFNVRKSNRHIHTNMAKASLAMLTKCLLRVGLCTHSGTPFSIHGCDPGWISVDEYYEDSRPWNVPPLDEVDGAARILFPLFAKMDSCSKTRRHFYDLTY